MAGKATCGPGWLAAALLAVGVGCRPDAAPATDRASTSPTTDDVTAPTDTGSTPSVPDDPCAPRFDTVIPCPGRGLYDGSVEVLLVPPVVEGPVLYTLDGTAPTPDTAQVADGPIVVAPGPDRGVVVLRTAVENGPVATHTYVFPDALLDQPTLPPGVPERWGTDTTTEGDYELDPRIVDADHDAALAAVRALPVVALTTEPDHLWGPDGLYMNPEQEGEAWERPVTVEVFHTDDEQQLQVDAGLRIQGGSSTRNWKADKLSLRLRFSADHGPAELDSDWLLGADGATSFDTLVLDAHLNLTFIHPDHAQRIKSQYVRDAVVADLQNAAGGLAPRSRFVHLLLNGLSWGIYDLHERPDASFAAHTLGGDEDAWDAVRHDGSLVDGTGVAWDTLWVAARSDLSDPAAYAAVEALLEVDDFIDYMLVNLYAGNTDWPHHNWYATRPWDGTSGWRFHSWDAEHVFKELDHDVTTVDDAGTPGELYQALRAQPLFVDAFEARAAALLADDGGLLGPASAQGIYDARMAEIEAAIVLESARWGDNQRPDEPYTKADVDAELQWLRDAYFPQRSAVVRAQLGL